MKKKFLLSQNSELFAKLEQKTTEAHSLKIRFDSLKQKHAQLEEEYNRLSQEYDQLFKSHDQLLKECEELKQLGVDTDPNICEKAETTQKDQGEPEANALKGPICTATVEDSRNIEFFAAKAIGNITKESVCVLAGIGSYENNSELYKLVLKQAEDFKTTVLEEVSNTELSFDEIYNSISSLQDKTIEKIRSLAKTIRE